MSDCLNNQTSVSNPSVGNRCLPCPANAEQCAGGTMCPVFPAEQETSDDELDNSCADYVGSLYQKIVRYALQACERPSKMESITDSTEYTPISESVLQDVNSTMDSIRVAMSKSLQTECERLGGYWVATPYSNTSEIQSGQNINPYIRFYDETGANKKWGYCADPTKAAEYYGTTTSADE